jgi:hypothetical protein
MPRFRTTFNGYAVRFSPFVEGRLAVATAQNFGIIGNGRLHVLEVRMFFFGGGGGGCRQGVGVRADWKFTSPDGNGRCPRRWGVFAAVCSSCANAADHPLTTCTPPTPQILNPQTTPNGLMEAAAFDTADGLYDVAWSEGNESVLVAASGDGSVKLYDLAAPPAANPLRAFQEHRREVSNGVGWGVFGIDWSSRSPWQLATNTWCYHIPPQTTQPRHPPLTLSTPKLTVLLRLLEPAAPRPLPLVLLGRHHQALERGAAGLAADVFGAHLLRLPRGLVRGGGGRRAVCGV